MEPCAHMPTHTATAFPLSGDDYLRIHACLHQYLQIVTNVSDM